VGQHRWGYFPDADLRWAWGAGAGGTKVLWNRANGIVFAGVGIELAPKPRSIPHILGAAIVGPNPLSAPAAVK
jgi:hypothetical protein